jgi:enoyl-CoA hydratase/carnithine racemase
MQNPVVRIEEHAGNPAISVVRISRPAQRNAINDEVIDGLSEAAAALREDTSVKAVILVGDGGFFSAGADLSTFEAVRGEPDVNRVRRMIHKGGRLCTEWERLPQLTIAAIEGGAVGGGLALAAACDWRVIASNAWIYVPEAKLGLNYGWNTLPRLNSLIGPARTKLVSIMCRRHGAAECERWGLADMVTEPEGALAGAAALAEEACAVPRLAAQLIKRSVNAHANALSAAASYADMEDMLVCMTDDEGNKARQHLIGELSDKGRRPS